MNKKMFTLALVSMLAILVLAGCVGSDANENGLPESDRNSE